ncbi:MAG: hypothetical protein R3192_05425 [Woeseiaceae bacterium]|nr:hypothetical protein [Woeseiaceae bacterium]
MTRPTNIGIASVFMLVLIMIGLPTVIVTSPTYVDDVSVSLALRRSAELAFVVFFFIFVARPAYELFPGTFTRALLRLRPYLGVAFAATMTVHLTLIAWRHIVVIRELPAWISLGAGGLAYALIFLMLLTTFEAPARTLGARNWRWLHKAGLYWIGIVFAGALLPRTLNDPSNPLYLAFGLMIVLAVATRLSAFAQRKRQSTAATESAR